MTNKRKNPRIELEREAKSTKVYVSSINNPRKLAARLINLSIGGICLHVSEALTRNERVNLHIIQGKHEIRLQGRALWISQGKSKKYPFRAGFRFESLGETETKSLAELIKTLLKRCAKKQLLEKLSQMFMMGYFAESDRQLSEEYFSQKEVKYERTLRKLKEIFETVTLLINDDEKAEELEKIYADISSFRM